MELTVVALVTKLRPKQSWSLSITYAQIVFTKWCAYVEYILAVLSAVAVAKLHCSCKEAVIPTFVEQGTTFTIGKAAPIIY